jgi:hypothetical protein
VHLGIVQEEEAVLSEFAALQVRERCGRAAPGAPNEVGSRGERSTEKAALETTVVGQIGERAGGLRRRRSGHMTVA